ncbi:TOMM precursor leader peptide-binding protein [Caulobacter sp. CCH9-E1]|jgi:bacteriocin biosynthesis cyclodehydratase domain-containing protein|uniref:TOMM precursor leader peptide-binding protein n=1 Tax=Caulobacter sp. CCH9-E1 TaxID=1768768 RepID=UPI0008299BDD|nr:TOMM precursor leader peptide-binding protein [Caulobacter sp. CCH9-E1]
MIDQTVARPRFREEFKVQQCDGQGVFLYTEDDFAILTGHAFEAVANRLDGTRTAEQLALDLEGVLDPSQVYYVLMQLQAKGYLVDAPQAVMPKAEAAYWRLSGFDPAEARKSLAGRRVQIHALNGANETDASILKGLLAGYGVSLASSEATDDADLTVVLTDNYLNPALSRFNAATIAGGKPWLLARPVGIQSWLGPYFDGQNACWSCLAQRLRGHRMVETFLENKLNLDGPPSAAFASTPATRATALALLAEEIARSLAGAPRMKNKVVSFDHNAMTTAEHVLVRRPQCPDCGDSSIKDGTVIALEPCARTFTAEAGHRSISPEETVRRFQHHVSPITGVIRELTSLRQEGDDVKCIYGAGHNFAMMIEDVSFLRATLRMGSGGKGKTDTQAKASAIGESLERYSGLFQGDEPRRLGRMVDIGESAIHPNDYLLFSDNQFRNRIDWNREHDRYQYVPEPFDPERPVEWTPLWSLTQQRFRHLPTACCYYGYSHHSLPRDQKIWAAFSHADSNGCAAGNTREEAILQGLFELAERDSVACWWYTRCQRPAVDLSGFEEPYFDRIQAHYRAMGRKIWVIDVTNDTGIPTFVAVSCREDSAHQEIIWGCGAHLEARIAILRALTEANQFLAAFDRFTTDGDRYIGFDPEAVRWFQTAHMDDQRHLAPNPDLPARQARDYASAPAGDLTEELRDCIGRLERLGLEVLVLDQTRADVQLPVVRVVVPGLRHFFARFAPGRLYDVPHALGWAPTQLSESQLNPIPVFF